MFLFEWLLEVAREIRRMIDDNWGWGGPARRMGRQLRIMYGRGEIDKKTFFRLRSDLEKGYYLDGELRSLHRQGAQRLQLQGRFIEHHFNPEVRRSLENIYLNRAMLEEVRHAMEQALSAMEAQRAWISEQVDSIRASAQAALPDENLARGYLEIRHDLLERAGQLEARAQNARQNLRQLDRLAAELGVYESELMLVDSQEQYASVLLGINNKLALLQSQRILIEKQR